MKFVIVLVVLVAAASTIDVYPTKYDNIDIDAILNSKRLLNNYLLCLLNQGKCTEEGQVLKDVIPDALITGCSKCNEHQKVSVEKVVKYLIKERNSDWQKLLQVYDPQGQYQQQYAHYLQ